MMAFETVSEATKLWIKGREFTVARLLGPRYADEVIKYSGGALAIFRLAPQVSIWKSIIYLIIADVFAPKDYHRFHSPVDGTIGPMTYIHGEYYTVNVRLFTSADLVLALKDNPYHLSPYPQPQAVRSA
jgi:phosphatidylserine decarboxylase